MIKKRIFIKGDLILESPISIGSGSDNFSDKDIVVDADFKPFIPATSLAGCIRDYLTTNFGKGITDELFGSIKKEGSTKGFKSNIIFYHAYLKQDKYNLIFRDGIRIDRTLQTTIDKSKYDFQAIDKGTVFDFKAEVEIRDKEKELTELIDYMLNALADSHIRIGYKKNRGYGKFKLSNIKKLTLQFPDDAEKWINFDWEKSEFEEFKPDHLTQTDYKEIKATFDIPYQLIVRDFDINEEADFVNIKSDGKPIIPATSWTGIIRSTLEKISEETNLKTVKDMVDEIFGYVDNKNSKPSSVIIEDSPIEDAIEMNYTQNRIDRFTSGVIENALFTQKNIYTGRTTLSIKVKSNVWNKAKDLLMLAITEIGLGLAPIGGSKTTGKGILTLKELNYDNKTITIEDLLSYNFSIPSN